jgi:hypothetical protein
MSSMRAGALGAVAVAVAVAAVVVIGIFWASARNPTAPETAESAAALVGAAPAQADSARHEIEALHAQLAEQQDVLARVTSRMAQMEQELLAARTPAIRESDPYGEAEEALQITPEQFEDMMRAREEEAIEQDRRRLAAIDSGWMQEPVDRGWSVRYEDDVRAALSSDGFEAVALMGINCRSSVCKLELSGDSAVDAQELSLDLIDLEPFQDTEFTITIPENGSPGQVVIYLARPGGQGLSHLSGDR